MHQRTSSEDLSILNDKLSKKVTSRRRSVSSSILQSKTLEKMFKSNRIKYDQEIQIPENDNDYYQTLVGSLPITNSNVNLQPTLDAFNMTSNITNSNHNSYSSVDEFIDPNLYDYDYDYDSSLIDTDCSLSFNEHSRSSYNNSLSESLNSSIEPINLFNSTNTNEQVNTNNPFMTLSSSVLPLDVDPSNISIDNSEMLINDAYNTLLPYQNSLTNNFSNSFDVKSQNNVTASTDILQPSINDIMVNNSVHSPDFDAIIASTLDSIGADDIKSFNITDDILLSNSQNPTFTKLSNTLISTDTAMEPTITVPSNDSTNKSKRLSQLQQKNNLTIITSAGDLDELTEPVEIFELPSSAMTSTKNSIISNIHTNTTDSNISPSSYLLSKMTHIDKFNALNLYNSGKHKNSIHAQPRPHPRNRRHNQYQQYRSHSQCNSASVTMDNKSVISSVYPLSASAHHQNAPFDYLDNFTMINGFDINSATGSTPSTYSGTNSATTNNSCPHSFGLVTDLENSHENAEVHSSNSSIHSTTRTSSSIIKKSKPIGIKFNTLKKSSSLSKLNSTSNSLLPTPESYDSSSISTSLSSSSSSSLCLNLAELQALSLEPKPDFS